jgi:hypothetical protein
MFMHVPTSSASGGDDPWCIVNDEGEAHCYYRTSQDCLQAIAGGARGFCNVSPWSTASTPAATAQPAQRKRRTQ